MKKFEFSMERVLKVKEINERDLLRELQEAREEKEKEEKHLTKLQDIQQKYQHEFFENMDTPTKVHEARRYSHYFPELANHIEEQKKRLMKAENKLDKYFSKWQEAQKERKIMENLKERKWEEHKREQLKIEQKLFDEMAQIPKGSGLNRY